MDPEAIAQRIREVRFKTARFYFWAGVVVGTTITLLVFR